MKGRKEERDGRICKEGSSGGGVEGGGDKGSESWGASENIYDYKS